jgi:hypothetical protein
VVLSFYLSVELLSIDSLNFPPLTVIPVPASPSTYDSYSIQALQATLLIFILGDLKKHYNPCTEGVSPPTIKVVSIQVAVHAFEVRLASYDCYSMSQHFHDSVGISWQAERNIYLALGNTVDSVHRELFLGPFPLSSGSARQYP